MELAFVLAGWQIHEKGRHLGSMTLVVMCMKNPGGSQCGNKPLKQWQGLVLRRGHCKEQRQQCPRSDVCCLHPGPLPEPLAPVYSCAQFPVSVSSSFACIRVSGGVLSQTLRPIHTDWTGGSTSGDNRCLPGSWCKWDFCWWFLARGEAALQVEWIFFPSYFQEVSRVSWFTEHWCHEQPSSSLLWSFGLSLSSSWQIISYMNTC